MTGIKRVLILYDIMCHYGVHLVKRITDSKLLPIIEELEILMGIGLFHVHGHKDTCLCHFSPSYIIGAGLTDGEMIEWLWSALNEILWSTCSMSLPHRQEVLDSHINYSNWKKLIKIVFQMTIRWKRVIAGLPVSTQAFKGSSDSFGPATVGWGLQEQLAQSMQTEDLKVMDIYDNLVDKAPSRVEVQQQLAIIEEQNNELCGKAAWLSLGLQIQEKQLTIRYDVRKAGPNTSPEVLNGFDEQRARLLKQIDDFHHQVEHFLLYNQQLGDAPLFPIDSFAAFDDVDDLGDTSCDAVESCKAKSRKKHNLGGWHRGLGGALIEEQDIMLLSTLGLAWCGENGCLAAVDKELQLHIAQVHDAIQKICLALGFKAALYRTKVYYAQKKWTKSRAWGEVIIQEGKVQESAWIYSACHKAVKYLRGLEASMDDLPLLSREHLGVHNLLLGAEPRGQRNTQLLWVWSFGRWNVPEGTWIDDFNHVHWLRAKAQFDRWKEEEQNLWHEAEWVPRFFDHKSSFWGALCQSTAEAETKPEIYKKQ
ncbi:hypothetical protein BC834DRAFT_847349 [Gloeopeniophorella convolvens]|nr:hypothetical protein BC834DRAFT_847349 [Gloeopeniophorella convolvens]